MAVILALIGGAWLLYFYLPVATYAYFWGFFAMAAILLVVGAGGRAARRQDRQTQLPAGARDGDRRGQENPRHGQRPGDRARRRRRGRRRCAATSGGNGAGVSAGTGAGTAGPPEGRPADAARTPRRSATRWRPTARSWRCRWRSLRGEVTRLTDWRTHVERHRREIVIGAAVVGFASAPRMLRAAGAARQRRRLAV